jgi:hypothetical protein
MQGIFHAYYTVALAPAMGGSMGGSDTSRQITAWVEEHFSATTVGGATVYDLTAGGVG